MFYRLQFDSKLRDQWFLGTPTNYSGDEWAFWRLLRGEALDENDLRTWRALVEQEGQGLPFSFAGFDVPIVSEEVAKFIAGESPGQVQLLPVEIKGASPGYRILVATKTIRCVDECSSEFTKWGADDGRPDKAGEYRMFTHLCLDPTLIPVDLKIFRVWGWRQALIVSDDLAESLRSYVKTGLIYDPVA